MDKITTPDPQKLYSRYKDSDSRLMTWKSRIKEIYKYCAPIRDDYESRIGDTRTNEFGKGSSKTRDVFDSTAIDCGITFANNLQLTLMPPLQEWITLSTTPDEQEMPNKNEADKLLQNQTHILFDELNKSNLDQVINEAFQDLYVGTAFIYINESSGRSAFEFGSIPTKDVTYEVGANDRIENIWRVYELSGYQIQESFDQSRLDRSFLNEINRAPTKLHRLIEGAVVIPNNPSDKSVYYYIQLETDKKIIYDEWREISPFIGFRYQKAPGESFGRGPADFAFPDVKTLNLLAMFMMTSAKWWAYPMFLVDQALTMNPYNVRIEPGTTIPFNPLASGGQDPVRPIPVAGNPNILESLIQNLRISLKERLFGDPLGNVAETKNRSASEMSIRWQYFLQKNGASAGRLAQELIFPIIDRALRILRQKGLIQDLIIKKRQLLLSLDNKSIRIEYNSPLLLLQKEKDVQNFSQFITLLLQLFGITSLLTLDLPKLIIWLAKKTTIDLELLKTEDEIKKVFKQLTKTITGAPQQPQPQTTPLTAPLMNIQNQQGQQ